MIVITTMDALPECCYECPCNNGEHGICKADKEKRSTSEYRPYWCPLKEVSMMPDREKVIKGMLRQMNVRLMNARIIFAQTMKAGYVGIDL